MQPFAFDGALQLQADQSLPPVPPIPFSIAGEFSSQQYSKLQLSAPPGGSIAVPFGTVASPGALALIISYPAGQASAVSVLVTINGGSTPLEISPGGAILWFNPSPAVGAVSCSIAYTASCELDVWVLG
jgi:hypothetical protein